MITAQIIGGVALIVFGIRFLRKGLTKLFGTKLDTWLASMTKNPWKALFAGIVVGTVAPSSTGISLISVQMMQSGLIDAGRVLAVLQGANIGMTVTLQLMAFKIESYSGLLIALGLLGFQFFKRDVIRGIGQCLMAMGFIFLSMQMIGEGAREAATQSDIVTLFTILGHHPLLVLCATSLFSILLQSSTSTIGLGLALSASGLIDAKIMIPWVIGTNFGVTITTLAAGWQSVEGRRLGVSNFMIKVIASLPLILFPSFALALFTMIPGSFDRQTVVFHTLFNALSGVLGVLISGILMRLVHILIVPVPSTDLSASHTLLNDQALENPSLALAHATREALRMGEVIRLMLDNFWVAYQHQNIDLAMRVAKEDERINQINRDLRLFLTRIYDDKNAEETQWQLILHTFSNELESVGDVIDRNLCERFLRHPSLGKMLPPPEANALEKIHGFVTSGIDTTLGLLTNRNANDAEKFLQEKMRWETWCQQEQLRHYRNLYAVNPSQIDASVFFLDLFNSYQRIINHLGEFANTFRYEKENKD